MPPLVLSQAGIQKFQALAHSRSLPHSIVQRGPWHQELLCFLRRITKEVPKELELHLIVVNYWTHKHAKVQAWLEQLHRFQDQSTSYASWINKVERWYELISQKAIQRGSFPSVKELISKIERFAAACSKTKIANQ